MTKLLRAALALLFIVAPALTSAAAQSAAYSFDNFDTQNGVRVYSEPVRARVSNPRSRRAIRNDPSNKALENQGAQTVVTAEDPGATIKPTALLYEPVAVSAVDATSPLH